MAVASTDGTAKLWDVESGTELVTFTGRTNAVWGVGSVPTGSQGGDLQPRWDGEAVGPHHVRCM